MASLELPVLIFRFRIWGGRFKVARRPGKELVPRGESKGLLRGIFLVLLLLWLAPVGAGQVVTENVTARLLAERQQVAPGDSVQLALVFDIRPGWHTYWKNPGDSGEPPRIRWRLPEGVSVGPIRWPHPELIRIGPLANYGYSGRAVHLMDLAVPAGWEAGRALDLTAEVSWLVCKEHCIPESGVFPLRLDTGARAGPEDPAVAPIFARARANLPQPLQTRALLRPDGAGLALDVDVRDLPGNPSRVWFFAGDWGLIEHAAEQPWSVRDGRLVLDLRPGSMADQAATDGILVIEGDAGISAYTLQPVRRDISASPSLDLGLPLALGFALLGGLILNLMPCVFPVLALKALSLTRGEDPDAKERLLQGLAYTAGVLGFFALLAGGLLAMRASGAAIGWGFQLQSPTFVVLMAYLFFVLGLSLAGAVTLGARLMGLGVIGTTSGLVGSFFTGGLAALVAAPCTAPFMGVALGYALTLSWPWALAVMLTLGLGLALPYLLLSLIPGIWKIFPKPGRWMDNLKQFLAFPLFATAAWLIWVLSVQVGPSAVAAVLAGMLFLALGLWIRERSRQGSGRWPLLGAVTGALLLGCALLVGILPGGSGIGPVGAGVSLERAPDDGLASRVFSLDLLEEARSQGRPVFVNMTAAWCITCLVNERVALSSTDLSRAFDAAGVLYLKGDWTNRDPAITRYLEGFGRSGVPIYVYYPPGGGPLVLPQILTESIVLDALGAVGADGAI